MLGEGNSGAWQFCGRTSVMPGGHSSPGLIWTPPLPCPGCATSPAQRMSAPRAARASVERRITPPLSQDVTLAPEGIEMSDLTVVWEEEALKLLEERDRFTRNAIRQEFGRDPKKDAIQFDPDHATYATPVS